MKTIDVDCPYCWAAKGTRCFVSETGRRHAPRPHMARIYEASRRAVQRQVYAIEHGRSPLPEEKESRG